MTLPVGKGSILRATNAGSNSQTSVSKNTKNMVNILPEILIDQIIPVPDNWIPYKKLNPQVSELVESIRKHGMIEPVILRQMKDNQFQLLAGYKRLEAMKELGLKAITARVFEGLSDKEAKEVFYDLHMKNKNDTDKIKDNIHETKFQIATSISREMPTYLL